MARNSKLWEWADKNGHNHPSGAWVASNPDEGDYHRREGYRLAGRLLLEQHSQATAATLIYPALAVYRHHYELQLKYLVGVAHQVLETMPPKTRGHDLLRLLPPVEEAVTKAWHVDAKSELRRLRECTEFLTVVDPVGESMRYSLGNKGPTVEDSVFLDPPQLVVMLEGGADDMGGVEMGLHVWIDDRNEYRAEMDEERRYYEDEYCS